MHQIESEREPQRVFREQARFPIKAYVVAVVLNRQPGHIDHVRPATLDGTEEFELEIDIPRSIARGIDVGNVRCDQDALRRSMYCSSRLEIGFGMTRVNASRLPNRKHEACGNLVRQWRAAAFQAGTTSRRGTRIGMGRSAFSLSWRCRPRRGCSGCQRAFR